MDEYLKNQVLAKINRLRLQVFHEELTDENLKKLSSKLEELENGYYD